MAWYFDQTTGDLREKDPNEDQGMDLSGGSVAGGGTSVNTGGAQAAGPAPTSSGNFTNFNKYIEMNQPQAEGLGQKVAGGIGQKTEQAGGALSAGEKEFNERLGAAGPALTPEQIKEAAKDPTKFVTDPNNISAFQSTLQGNYGGPNAFGDIANYQGLVDAVQKAAQAAEQVKTSGGREELIKDVYAKPERAKAGMLGLDEALLKGTSGAIAPVQEKAAEAGKLNDRISQIQDTATKAVEDQKGKVAGASKEAYDSFLGDTGAYNMLKSGISDRLSKTTTEAEAARDEAKKYLDFNVDPAKPGYLQSIGAITQVPYGEYKIPLSKLDPSKIKISDAALGQLGVTKDQYIDLLNKQIELSNIQKLSSETVRVPGYDGVVQSTIPFTSLSDFYNTILNTVHPLSGFGDYLKYSSPTGITASNVATPEEYKTLEALSQLLGDQVDSKYISTPDQAGKYSTDLTDFDYKSLINYLTKQKSDLDKAMGFDVELPVEGFV